MQQFEIVLLDADGEAIDRHVIACADLSAAMTLAPESDRDQAVLIRALADNTEPPLPAE